ncbi:hypothetical protein K5F35_03755 [Acinetobacter baumannii]|uniref:hypothetical protein n=1 Tax=Acinetobacter baumannii TaxID=470 RepID=UPI001FF10642|nr:hypothetical protein [Acinetobacter baumannii]MCJ9204692.1 hypothetical protein [Acinetobacter baumannii]MCJ9329072.1 hypothetical protein [Acinetobacter baumannii]
MALLLSAVRTRFFDKSNKPLAGGKVYTYEANSTDPKLTWSDTDLSVPNTNPVLLDNEGTAYVYLDGNYRIRVEDKDGVLIEDNPFVQSFFTKFGLPADLVIDKNETQKEINDKTIQEIESINDLINITPRKDGQVVYVKSYHSGKNAGGGQFIYKSTLSTFNDGIIVFNGWARVWDSLNIQPEWAGAVEGEDCTVALQKCLDFISPTAFDTSVAVMNLKKGGIALDIPPTKLGYIISDTLWIGAGSKIHGTGKMSFMTPLDTVCSKIITNFTDPLKPAISTSNWKTGGVRVAYDEKTSGQQYDDGLISHTPDLVLDGFNLFVADDTRCYMGARIQNSPLSKINISCQGFDYGIMMNASWVSKVDSFALSHKCGLLADFDNNGCVFDGYYNSDRSLTPLSATNLVNFFDADTDIDVTLNEENKTFGFVSRYAYGAASTSMVCEGSHANIVIAQGGFDFSSMYTEKALQYGLVVFSSKSFVNIGLHAGAFDAGVYCVGSNGRLNVKSYTKDGTTQENIFKKVSIYGTIINAPVTLNAYNASVSYQLDDFILYLSTTGSDLNNGVLNNYPLRTLDEALKRIAELHSFSNTTIKSGSRKAKIIILSSGDFNISQTHNLFESVIVERLSSLSTNPVISISGHIVLNDADLSFYGCDIKKSNASGDIENACVWTRNGRNSVSISGGVTNIQDGGLIYCDYNGCSDVTLLLNAVTVQGVATSQLVQSNYLNTSPHIVNVVRSRGSISAAITGRPDKGISVPVSWQNKILGL